MEDRARQQSHRFALCIAIVMITNHLFRNRYYLTGKNWGAFLHGKPVVFGALNQGAISAISNGSCQNRTFSSGRGSWVLVNIRKRVSHINNIILLFSMLNYCRRNLSSCQSHSATPKNACPIPLHQRCSIFGYPQDFTTYGKAPTGTKTY